MFTGKKYIVLSTAVVLMALGLVFTTTPALAANVPGCTEYYRVRPGDSLSSIGMRFGVAPYYIAEINNIPYTWLIYSGTRLCVSTENAPAYNYGTGGPYNYNYNYNSYYGYGGSYYYNYNYGYGGPYYYNYTYGYGGPYYYNYNYNKKNKNIRQFGVGGAYYTPGYWYNGRYWTNAYRP
jgi:hypothetical protein